MNNISFNEYQSIISEYTKDSPCPVRDTIEIFQKKWSLQIIFELSKKDSIRFGELKKTLGNITNTMLTTALKDLEGKGLIIRKQFNEIPPHVEYSLSKAGKNLYPVFMAMAEWGGKYL
ncbi:MAG: helix-turn-helix domain-containing protein [Tissierellia bacterium]|nr:helix-turn-helix domain-containing protein [Tissierellia bacterium]